MSHQFNIKINTHFRRTKWKNGINGVPQSFGRTLYSCRLQLETAQHILTVYISGDVCRGFFFSVVFFFLLFFFASNFLIACCCCVVAVVSTGQPSSAQHSTQMHIERIDRQKPTYPFNERTMCLLTVSFPHPLCPCSPSFAFRLDHFIFCPTIHKCVFGYSDNGNIIVQKHP